MLQKRRKINETAGFWAVMPAFLLSLGLGIIFSSILATTAAAQVKRLGKFQYWEAYTDGADEKQQCFIISTPQRKQPRNATRGEIFFTITHRPYAGTFNEPALRVGYPMTDKVFPSAEIDGKRFRFFSGTHVKNSEEEWSWLADLDQMDSFIDQLKAGSLMVYSGQSKRGTKTRDSYSLMGFTRALEAIDKACPRVGN